MSPISNFTKIRPVRAVLINADGRTDNTMLREAFFLLFMGTCIKSPNFAHTVCLSFNVLFLQQAAILS